MTIRSLRLILLSAAAGLLADAVPARAQSPIPTPTERAALGATIEAPLMADLPVSDTLAGLLETLEPSVITDRFSGAGLYQGQGVRFGSFAGSWTQTIYRVGDVDVTDPNGGGTPLVPFDVLAWQRLQTASVGTAPDVNALGLSVTLIPLAPAARWTRSISAATSHGGLTAEGAAVPYPAIATPLGWDRVTFLASGPLPGDGMGAVVGGSWTRAGQLDRDGADISGSTGQAFGHLVVDRGQRGALRLFGSLQRAKSPFEHYRAFNDASAATTDTTGHLQASWERPAASGRGGWRTWVSYTRRQTAPGYAGDAAVTLERLVDGPVTALADVADVSTTQWSAGGRLAAPGSGRFADHAFEGGADISGARSRLDSFYQGRTLELIDGQPARWWEFSAPGESSRGLLRTAAFVSDRIRVSDRMVLDAALRFDAVTGRADGAAENITWYSWLPRIGFRWQRAAPSRTALFASYGRSAYRMPLSLLAAGDPSAPTAGLYRWNAGPLAIGPLVARVGPGTGGNAAFSAIDGGLKRPVADEWTIGVDFTPLPRLDVRFAGIARHERHLPGLVNTGLTSASYRTFGIPDPGSDVGLPDDDRVVTIYDRLPASFGLDRYLLTNPGETATFAGLEWTMRYTVSRLALFWGATAGLAQAPAVNRGFGPLENDQLLLGEGYSDPNAGTYARGRLFNDRAFTIKLAGVYRLPYDLTLGAIARYQDGQSFARVLVVPGLGQGTDAVRAFANGDSRFRFTGTLDLRLQKAVRLAAQQVALFVDVYNALDLEYEVEERAAAGPNIRTQTAVQPPRSIHVGARFSF